MIKDYEKLAAAYEGAQLQFKDDKIRCSLSGVVHSVSNVWITVPYKHHQIHIDNEYGISNTATVEMKVVNGFIPDFEIRNRSHFSILFSFNKSLFSIDCKNTQFKLKIEEALQISGIHQIAKENLFEPNIKLIKKEGIQFIHSEYHLQFGDKIGAAKALIEFYKMIIDTI
ncbi:hypothetical protein [Brumimicrobium mesophilum]|uniref:hypothetical protein n=1 Tax=Brumimicrobium mesophilum TaxID=392717 RepID=UPI000D1419C2|nr:hypothetical protein [Brumimicrobium mesophilum]